MRGVFFDLETVDRGDLDLSGVKSCLPEWDFFPTTEAVVVSERLAGAAVAVTNKVVLDEETLNCAPSLKLVCVAATGVNNVDLEAARQAGITVCNVRGYATPSVVQHVFTLILTLTSRLLDYRGAVAAGRWGESSKFCLLDYPIRELAGMTLGIVGYGELGRAVARLGEAFGME
ncbi:MAG: glycerate dehydrogenase, partial [Gammaproteobacteria bacterium]|nr:glycerate dehydrogenase [Gammaproteobacteria bacterium]